MIARGGETIAKLLAEEEAGLVKLRSRRKRTSEILVAHSRHGSPLQRHTPMGRLNENWFSCIRMNSSSSFRDGRENQLIDFFRFRSR